jgi:hypothetical protein
MAMTQNMPPQAYTRDTLVKAIEWVSSQPPSIREKASSADLIVSLYLSARRRSSSEEVTVRQEIFKTELKSMVEEFKSHDEPLSPPSPGPQAPTLAAAPKPPTRFPSPVRSPEHLPVQAFNWGVDERSLALARDLQERLNLGHESEALRLLIQLGAERARELFPRSIQLD